MNVVDETKTVGRWMTNKILSAAPGDPLYRAVELMAEERLRHVLVLNDEALVGILSNRDIIRATGKNPEGRLALHETTIEDVMTPGPLASVHPTTSLGEAADLMLSKHVNALPVLDEKGKLVGILTTEDILTSVSHSTHHRAPDL